MNRNLYTSKTPRLFFILILLIFLVLLEVLYIDNTKKMTQEMHSKKVGFVAFVGLPDLAISTEATFVRHRSMSDLFSIYKDDGCLREYFVSTYAYSHSHIINQTVGTKNEK